MMRVNKMFESRVCMTPNITFRFCGEQDRSAFDVSEVLGYIQRLTTPKASLLTNPKGLTGYLDFWVLDDSSIEMEVMEHADDDFARVDISMAARVVEIAMTDTRNLPLRRKLNELPIQWVT
jgi:hypothetical protein